MSTPSEQFQHDQEWRRRADALHEQEWAASQQLLRLAKRLLRQHLTCAQPASLAQIERILSLSSRLASLAGVPATQPPQGSAEEIARLEEAQVSLHKIYGQMAKTGVVPNVWEEINRARTNPAHPETPTPQPPPAPPPPPTPPQNPS